MEHYTLYHGEIPAVLAACANTPCMQRLRNVGMNCGCEYTSFPRFAGLQPYSRFDHSLGAALIVWRFTHDEKQAVAGLLHDVATPVFAHVVDFLKGDYLVQESTEDGTRAVIERDAALQRALSVYGVETGDVADYHRYPIADNDSPKLSADRLEYTLGNLVNYRIRMPEAVSRILADLSVGTNEDGAPELVFSDAAIAEDFALASLACSRIYVSDEDRYAMQMLSELLHFALDRGVLSEADLHTTEPAVIEKLLGNAETAVRWNGYCAMHAIRRAAAPQDGGAWRKIAAKKRRIDPLIRDVGRVSAYSERFRKEINAFLADPQTDWIAAE
jgi:HD superfamily phosphohydrolase